MAWRREHDGGIGRAASAWALGVAEVNLPQEAKDVRLLLLGWIRPPRGRTCASGLAGETLSSFGARRCQVHLWTLAKREGIIQCGTVQLIRPGRRPSILSPRRLKQSMCRGYGPVSTVALAQLARFSSPM
jgi:hypothetical protein